MLLVVMLVVVAIGDGLLSFMHACHNVLIHTNSITIPSVEKCWHVLFTCGSRAETLIGHWRPIVHCLIVYTVCD